MLRVPELDLDAGGALPVRARASPPARSRRDAPGDHPAPPGAPCEARRPDLASWLRLPRDELHERLLERELSRDSSSSTTPRRTSSVASLFRCTSVQSTIIRSAPVSSPRGSGAKPMRSPSSCIASSASKSPLRPRRRPRPPRSRRAPAARESLPRHGLPFADHGHVITHALDVVQVVRREEHRRPS